MIPFFKTSLAKQVRIWSAAQATPHLPPSAKRTATSPDHQPTCGTAAPQRRAARAPPAPRVQANRAPSRPQCRTAAVNLSHLPRRGLHLALSCAQDGHACNVPACRASGTRRPADDSSRRPRTGAADPTQLCGMRLRRACGGPNAPGRPTDALWTQSGPTGQDFGPQTLHSPCHTAT